MLEHQADARLIGLDWCFADQSFKRHGVAQNEAGKSVFFSPPELNYIDGQEHQLRVDGKKR